MLAPSPVLCCSCVGGAVEGKLLEVADFGAVLKPASKWDRDVRGVGAPLSWRSEGLVGSNERCLTFIPFARLEAKPEPGMPSPLLEG
jgi:hypothetical protein